MTIVEVEPGFAVNVEVAGSGPPIVLLHGFTGSAHAWGDFGRELARHYTTVAIDIAGHGQTTIAPDLDHFRMPQVVSDIVRAVAIVGFPQATWLGYSMGGRLGLHVLAARPDVVDSAILIGASPGLATEAGRAERRASDEVLAQMLEQQGVDAFVDYWESIPLFASQRSLPPEARAAVRAGRVAADARGLAASLRGMGTGAQEPLHERLPSIGVRTLLMAGELDERYCAAGRDMAAAMPSARFVTVPGVGHAAHTEAPAFCAREVIAFLQPTPESVR